MARHVRGDPIKHLFITVMLYWNAMVITIRAMIDSGASWNFFSQEKLKKVGVQIPSEPPPISEMKTLDGTPLSTFHDHC